MATAEPTTKAEAAAPYPAPISIEELRARNQAASAFLKSLVTDGDEQEQRETMDILREALGEHRIMSYRSVFR
jgi:hypothetical protein